MYYKVLIVDDSKTMRNIIEKTLRAADLPIKEVFHAENGKLALEILDENWVDIVFADINMPVMNGMEMISKMHEDGIMKTVPVVMVTTEGSQSRINELKKMGVSAYLRKPLVPEALRDVVFEILGGMHGQKL